MSGPGESELRGRLDVSSINGMSTSFSSVTGVSDGEGDSTTDGMRVWPCRVLVVCSGTSVIVSAMFSGSTVVVIAGVFTPDEGAVVAVPCAESTVVPDLTMRVTMSPSLMSYSCKSLPSERALPLSSSRAESAGGAPGKEASWDFTVAMVSAECTLKVYVLAGFMDLIVILIAPWRVC